MGHCYGKMSAMSDMSRRRTNDSQNESLDISVSCDLRARSVHTEFSFAYLCTYFL